MIYTTSNAYYFRHLNKIGGIESHLRYLAMTYAHKYEITVFFKTADMEQLDNLRRYVRCVQITDKDFVRCKRLFCCFNREILNQCEAEKKYLVLHGDYKNMLERGQLSVGVLPIDDRIDEYLGVSQLVCDSWYEVSGIKARNVFEPVVLEDVEKPLLFVSATRLTPEKGWTRMLELAEALDNANVNYTWFVYTNSDRPASKNMVMLPPRMDIANKIGAYDAFIQLSDNEGFCLSIAEALLRKVPVIATDLPVLKELGLNDTNSIILPFDMKDIPVERIRNIKKLKFSYKLPKEKWDEVLDHTPADTEHIIEVIACKGYSMYGLVDAQLGRIPQPGEKWCVTKSRYEDLIAAGEKKNCKFVVRA